MLPLLIAYIGNIIDTAATLYLADKGFFEANPIMASLLGTPFMFALVKISVMTILVIRLWTCRENKYARAASWVAAAVYGALSLYYGVMIAIYGFLCV